MGGSQGKGMRNRAVVPAQTPLEEIIASRLPSAAQQSYDQRSRTTTTTTSEQSRPDLPSRDSTATSSGLQVDRENGGPGESSSPTPGVSVTTPLQLTEETDLEELELPDSTGATRIEAVLQCLRSLEAGFGLNFQRELLLNNVRDKHYGPGEIVLRRGDGAVGVYIVKEGGLDIMSPEENVVLCRLQERDFCGELSSFFRIPCSATVRTQPGQSTILSLLPLDTLARSSHNQEVAMYRLLTWCSKRSYVGTADILDKLDGSLLIRTQIANCLKSPKSIFSTWSIEARNYIATKSTPMLFNSGDTLYEVGEEPNFLLIILRGTIEFSDAVETTEGSHMTTVRSSSQGCCIGEELLSGSRMAHTATALTPLLTVPITLELLNDTTNQFPSHAAKWKGNQERHI